MGIIQFKPKVPAEDMFSKAMDDLAREGANVTAPADPLSQLAPAPVSMTPGQAVATTAAPGSTPREQGYFFPAEFAPHRATWLSWPHKEASWPGKIEAIYPRYAEFVRTLALGEEVCINVNDDVMKAAATNWLLKAGADVNRIHFYLHPTNDAWCRDHGPAFLLNRDPAKGKAILDWGYNAWGGKYPPFDLDDNIPTLVGQALGLPVFYPGIVMEGGSVEFNGAGTVLTSTCCLLNPNRNPNLDQATIERFLCDFYGMEQVLWVSEGIVGDDTDGHIDDTVRFVNEDTVLTVVESNKNDENYALLQTNLRELKAMRLANGKPLNIVELPMPAPVVYEDQRLPASYANFYIANKHVIVPTYRCAADDRALRIIQECFPSREVVGIDSTDIIWGLGSFHCLSQQEPA
ncbi:agmatine deiminase family protein [Dinghuibacter silviterrae]|uniref:Agmatine deiminase n=1 Tax=Dinghuibacter silviterrae TaxID=1539049 RepID=A0A4R8DTA7_9BACT|nr:agmatine deiminase family protein [Dinghuibacter silviterrae]TDX01138.1 agmatine deiminase [Dinghuibacter silviterrae]